MESPDLTQSAKKRLCFLFSHSEERLRQLENPGAGATMLYSFERFAGGWELSHNFERRSLGILGIAALLLARAAQLVCRALGAPLGSWADVFRALPELRRAQLVFSTSDRVGIAAAFLRHWGLYRAPLVYSSIGLPERLELIRAPWIRKLVVRAITSSAAIVCYGFAEKEHLARLFPGLPIYFVPFGVDTTAFVPAAGGNGVDVLTVGRDTFRDFDLLFAWAGNAPGAATKVIFGKDQQLHYQGRIPAGVEIAIDVPIDQVKREFARAKIIALPVKENSYSGATTTLLQAMAMGKPVIVSSVGAIRDGYFLESGRNCVLVRPGDLPELTAAIEKLRRDEGLRTDLGARARETVERHLSQTNFVMRLEEIFRRAERGS